MNVDEIVDAPVQEAAHAYVLAAAIRRVLKGYGTAVEGAALGLVLGDWVKDFGPVDLQEKALDRVLTIAARKANNA